MVELNKKLQNLREDKNRPYGGVSIIFSGDFHQLAPVASSDSQILYSKSPKALWWVNLINCSIFLENNHRFKEDPEYGSFLERMRKGQTTSEDIDLFVNSRFVDGTDVKVPVDGEICYATANNKTRNAISSSIFREHIMSTHPPVSDDNAEPPRHTLMIEACIMKSCGRHQKPISPAVHEIIVSSLGDNNVQQIGSTTKVDPVLRCYPNAHYMISNNDNIDKGQGNGSLCRFVSVKLKTGARLTWKNWDGRKVNTVTADMVEWIKMEHWPEPPPNTPKFFKLKMKKYNTVVKRMPIPGSTGVTVDVGKIIMYQFPINSNIATTGHKLQGMSKDLMVVTEWGTFPNWVYVVLSRVRTNLGLFILNKLDPNKLDQFRVSKDLCDFEQKMRSIEKCFIDATCILSKFGKLLR
jgi:hypothetical protein